MRKSRPVMLGMLALFTGVAFHETGRLYVVLAPPHEFNVRSDGSAYTASRAYVA